MFSSIIPNPTELTITALLLSGKDRFLIFIILAISSIPPGLIAYYICFSGNKFLKILYKKPCKKHKDKTAASGTIRLANYTSFSMNTYRGRSRTNDCRSKEHDLKNFGIVMKPGKVL
jgi:membrane protein YqaA with SNARE-associated domain